MVQWRQWFLEFPAPLFPWPVTSLNQQNVVEMTVCNCPDYVIKGIGISSLLSLLEHSLWEKPGVMLWKLSSSPVESPTWQGIEAACQQPYEWASCLGTPALARWLQLWPILRLQPYGRHWARIIQVTHS